MILSCERVIKPGLPRVQQAIFWPFRLVIALRSPTCMVKIKKRTSVNQQIRLQKIDTMVSIPEELEEVINMLAWNVEKWSQEIEQRGQRDGHQAGSRDGEARMLTRLLHRRFGTIPEWATEKISKAGLPSLEEWGLRVLDARSLDEVFSDGA